MSRTLVALRPAEPADAPVLAELWADVLRRADLQDQLADLELLIKDASASPEQRLLVAEYDGQVAGAVLLRLTTLTPLNLEPAVQAISPHVLPRLRRHGVGRALMESAVAFAEELGVPHLATAAAAGSRDANRFLARLGLGPYATFRIAPTQSVRSKLPSATDASGRQRTRVLAARRSIRRARSI